MADVLERPRAEEALRVWVVDDIAEDAESLARSFEAAGAVAQSDVSLSKIGERVQTFQDGEPAPHVIVIDQRWAVRNTTLAVLGRRDILIDSNQNVGAALGVFFRSVEPLDDSILMMTSINQEEVQVSPVGLAPALAVHKSQIRALPEAIGRGDSPADALADLGIDRDAVSQARRTSKFLTYAAGVFGLRDVDAARLAGATRGVVGSDDALRQFVWTSRDAHTRSRELQTILVLLRQVYGDDLPPLGDVASQLGLPMQAVLEGEHQDLVRLRMMLEAKAGGPLA